MADRDEIIQEDMEYIRQRIDHIKIAGSTVLISGAAGLIGKYLVRFLAQYCGCKVLAVVRDRKKAYRLWNDLGDQIEYICSDITELEEKDLADAKNRLYDPCGKQDFKQRFPCASGESY